MIVLASMNKQCREREREDNGTTRKSGVCVLVGECPTVRIWLERNIRELVRGEELPHYTFTLQCRVTSVRERESNGPIIVNMLSRCPVADHWSIPPTVYVRERERERM